MSLCGTRLLCFDCVTGTICEEHDFKDSQAGNEAIWPMFYRAVSSKRELCYVSLQFNIKNSYCENGVGSC